MNEFISAAALSDLLTQPKLIEIPTQRDRDFDTIFKFSSRRFVCL